jgi:hypothetical protein
VTCATASAGTSDESAVKVGSVRLGSSTVDLEVPMKRTARLIAGLGAFGLLASGLSSAPADAARNHVPDGQQVRTAGTATIERSLYLTGDGTTGSWVWTNSLTQL